MALVRQLLGLLLATTAVSADLQFRSRPDLSPPRLNITIPASEDVAPGYIFVAQYPGFEDARAGPEQTAAYIFRNDGDLVWSSLGYFPGWVANFQAVRYKGRPVLQAFAGYLDSFHGHGYGVPMMLDDHYQPVAALHPWSSRLVSIHEFKIVDEETALVEVYQPTLMDLTAYGGGDDEKWIADGVFQEIDIATGEVLFEGHTLDFADPADSMIPLRSGRAFTGANATDAWDYFHINSVDRDDRGDYLVSGRHMSAIYKVSGRDGSLLWQLGGQRSSFELGAGLDFGYQHDARFRYRSDDGEIEVISFFDNSARSDRQRAGGVDRLHPHSRGRVVRLNTTDMTASAYQTFIPPDMLSVPSQGNVQLLPGGGGGGGGEADDDDIDIDMGNVFVNWGQEGAVTEFRADGTPIFHAYLDSGAVAPGVQSYRGFRYEWEGHSNEAPAVVALLQSSSKSVTAFVSWNGDTTARAWRFSCRRSYGDGDGSKMTTTIEEEELGTVERTSFETSLTVPAQAFSCFEPESVSRCYVFAEALDAGGRVLRASSPVLVQADVDLGGSSATASGATTGAGDGRPYSAKFWSKLHGDQYEL